MGRIVDMSHGLYQHLDGLIAMRYLQAETISVFTHSDGPAGVVMGDGEEGFRCDGVDCR